TSCSQPLLQAARPLLMSRPFDLADLQVSDARQCAGHHRGGQRGRENKAGSIAANGIAALARGGDITAHHAETLGKRAVDNVDAVSLAIALGDAATARAIDANRMHLVDVG